VKIEEIYLEQIGQISNGITAFALAQTLGFALAIFSVGAFRKQIENATLAWLCVPTAVGVLMYCGLVSLCCWAETTLLQAAHGSAFLWVPISFAAGRIVAVVLSMIPLVLIMRAVRIRRP
jgi:biotin transporter BioY